MAPLIRREGMRLCTEIAENFDWDQFKQLRNLQHSPAESLKKKLWFLHKDNMTNRMSIPFWYLEWAWTKSNLLAQDCETRPLHSISGTYFEQFWAQIFLLKYTFSSLFILYIMLKILEQNTIPLNNPAKWLIPVFCIAHFLVQQWIDEWLKGTTEVSRETVVRGQWGF